ncbi:unnamed protein product [Caenorhabditis bovis]|uniref:Methylosome subunit pICln n=1 Tax=Caenorhabditis bovis TaxID=2654633 RepID=A0A8S1EZL3_9PELO|nr:unnamed protein product [Caenorhabditis bovis]
MSLTLSNVTAPTEQVKLVVNSVQLYFETQCFGNGELHISEANIVWISNLDKSKGISIPYRSVVLHAVSTECTDFPQEHVYVLVDGRKTDRRRRCAPVFFTQEEAQTQEDLHVELAEINDESDDESGDSHELRLVPDDKEKISEIYHNIMICQELNPEEDESFSEDDDMEENMDYDNAGDNAENGNEYGRWYTAENMEDVELSEEGLANLQRIMGNNQNGHNDSEMQ